jgi:methylated-DNA-[protein]-cysteine S-methyltransferase
MTTTNQTPPLLYAYVSSPIGRLLLCGDDQRLTGLYTPPASEDPGLIRGRHRSDPAFAPVCEQLEEYFAGERVAFDVRLGLDGATPFRRNVWTALLDIPYGATVSYGELAARLGVPSAARAVGAANGSNPISIIVPCHRVVGSGGDLTGYAGGLERKRYLLRHETEVLRRSPNEPRAPGQHVLERAAPGHDLE